MFQDINVTKSAPFALLTISQKSMYSPKVFKMPPFRQITQMPRSSPTQSANYAKFAPFANITPYVSNA